MEVKKVGNRGTLFTFHDLGIPTNVYTINGDKHSFIIDTYLGPDIMEAVRQHVVKGCGNKPIIVINSHSHWDHVWGNSLFSSSQIIGHKKCREYIQQEGLAELKKNEKYQRGEIILTCPNLTITEEIRFEDDNVIVYYTPGHTDDSISILDISDRVLFAGDNLERPIPFLMSKDLKRYVQTLQDYLDAEADVVIGGHTACEDKGLIEHNLQYVKKVLSGEKIEMESKEFEEYHLSNMEKLGQ